MEAHSQITPDTLELLLVDLSTTIRVEQRHEHSYCIDIEVGSVPVHQCGSQL